MKQFKLENIKEKFYKRNCDRIGYPEEMFLFFEILLTILSDTASMDELLFTMQLLINDFENGECGFHNSLKTIEKFKDLRSRLDGTGKLSVILSYIPRYIDEVTDSEFSMEFSRRFGQAVLGKYDIEVPKRDYGYIEIRKDVIDISNKDKAEVLAGLYNNSQPMGMGMVQYDSTPMSIEVARKILEKEIHFEYLLGRPLKISFYGNIIQVYGYNSNNGQDLAQKVISSCRNINDIGKGKLKRFESEIEEKLQKEKKQELVKKGQERMNKTASYAKVRNGLECLKVSQDEMQPIRRLIEESAYNISDNTLEFVKNIENQAYPESMKVMQDIEVLEDLEEVYEYQLSEITIARNIDWYIIYGEDADSVEILDIASLPTRDRIASRKEMHNYIIKVINQKANNGNKPVTLNAKEDTSYRMIQRMVDNGEYEILDDVRNTWETDESIQMHDLVLRPIMQRDRENEL